MKSQRQVSTSQWTGGSEGSSGAPFVISVPEIEEFLDFSLGKDLVDFQFLGAALSTSNSEELLVAEA